MIIAGLAVFVVCIISGIMTGLLGIGGGLIIVPFFMSILPLFNISFSVVEIVAISATCVFFNSTMSVFYRRKEKYLPKSLLAKLAVSIIIGTVSGSYMMNFVPEKIVFLIFILVAFVSLALMIRKNDTEAIKKFNLNFLLYIIFAFIGMISSMIGIGGAVLFAAALKLFITDDIKKLLPTITLLVLVHALFAFSSKLILGEVILYMIPISVIASAIGSMFGVKLSKKLSAKAINILMCLVLIFGIIRMTVAFVV